jgi:hypothetical protein
MANEPLTNNQRYFLKGCGVDTTDMTKPQAKQLIIKLKQKAQ